MKPVRVFDDTLRLVGYLDRSRGDVDTLLDRAAHRPGHQVEITIWRDMEDECIVDDPGDPGEMIEVETAILQIERTYFADRRGREVPLDNVILVRAPDDVWDASGWTRAPRPGYQRERVEL